MVKGNPLLSKVSEASGDGVMSFAGVTVKSLLLLGIMMLGATYSYGQGTNFSTGMLIGSVLGGFVLAMITIFNPKVAPFTSPVYAGLEGLALGAISLVADTKYPGIAMEAVLSTSAVFLVMLLLYSNRIIRVNHKFAAGLMAAMTGILVIYLADIILALFGITMPVVRESSPWGIAFSVGVVIVAALSLAMDFNQIEEGVESRAPKSMEWFSAFGLMVSLVWLYLEILSLLRKLKD